MSAEYARAAASTVLFKSLLGARSGMPTMGRTKVLVVTDKVPCTVASELESAYRRVLLGSWPSMDGSTVAFDPKTFREEVQRYFANVDADCNKVVILIENGAFQNELHQYRLRLELFRSGIRVAEHCHLKSMETQSQNYLQSCQLDPFLAHQEGLRIKSALDSVMRSCTEVVPSESSNNLKMVAYDLAITSGANNEHTILFTGGLEPCLLNTGLYAGASAETAECAHEALGSGKQQSVGGTFPVGEVITESIDLACVEGSAEIFAFPTTERKMCILKRDEPQGQLLKMDIRGGVVTGISDDSGSFGVQANKLQEVLDLIKSVESDVWVRELGIGLNPFLGINNPLADVTSFERQRGVHLSIGKRHPLFPKRPRADVELIPGSRSLVPSPQKGPVLRRKDGTFHIDVFIAANQLILKPKAAFKATLEEKVLLDFTSSV